MLWKILSIVSAIALAVGLWFSLGAKGKLQEERKLALRSQQNLEAVKKEFVNAESAKSKHAEALVQATKQRDELKETIAKVNADVELKLKEAEAVNANLTEIKKQVTQLEEEIRKAGDIEKLLAEVKLLNEQKVASESALANKQQQVALADTRVANAREEIKRVQELEAQQKRGMVATDFTARISQAFPAIGFVILNKGNRSGLFANAMLEVKRGHDTVAKLKVRDVEQSASVADLLPGSVTEGTEIRAGDLVIASKEQPSGAAQGASASSAQGATPAAAAAADTPAPAPGMAEDPFGAVPAGTMPDPSAPAAGGMAEDPFGAAPPATPSPTPAPAPAAEDPFGTTTPPAAPATPPPAAVEDPFGAAPAPAAGGAMMSQ